MDRSILACAVVVVSCAVDAIRDANISRDPIRVSWIMWHSVKWASIFPLWIIITCVYVPWEWWAVLAIVCRIVWRLAHQIKLDGMMMNFPIFNGK